MTTERSRRAIAIIEDVKNLWADVDPGIRGAILASLLTDWVTEHPEPMRQMVFDMHVGMVRDSIEQRKARKVSKG